MGAVCPDYDFCIKIGGFANISFDDNEQRLAYDICPANIILNHLANKLGHEYDKNGALGFLGKLDKEILEKLNKLEHYHRKYPKSLGKEWLIHSFIPILQESLVGVQKKERTDQRYGISLIGY